MPARAVATLPGAPLVLKVPTEAVAPLPPELVHLRQAVDVAVASLPAGPRIVVAATVDGAVWGSGDLGLGGFGTGDPALPWRGADAAALAERLGLPLRSGDIPTEARVVARLVGPEHVTAVVGLPPDDRLAALLAAPDADDEADAVLAVVGDLSASIGPRSPRPGDEPDLDRLITDGAVDGAALNRFLTDGANEIAGALRVAVAPATPPLIGAVHVVRGVATLVATSTQRLV